MSARAVRTGGLCALVLVLAATGAPGAADAKLNSGVKGTLFRGVPGCTPNDSQECGTPYDGVRVRVRRARTQMVVRAARTNADGKFVIRLRPGRYVVEYRLSGRRFRFAKRVRRGRFTDVSLRYPGFKQAPRA